MMSYQFLMITDVLSEPLTVLSTVRRQVPDHQGLGRAAPAAISCRRKLACVMQECCQEVFQRPE